MTGITSIPYWHPTVDGVYSSHSIFEGHLVFAVVKTLSFRMFKPVLLALLHEQISHMKKQYKY